MAFRLTKSKERQLDRLENDKYLGKFDIGFVVEICSHSSNAPKVSVEGEILSITDGRAFSVTSPVGTAFSPKEYKITLIDDCGIFAFIAKFDHSEEVIIGGIPKMVAYFLKNSIITKTERREFFRVKYNGPVHIYSEKAMCKDLSAGGIGFYALRDYFVKSKIKVSLSINSRTVDFKATVVRCKLLDKKVQSYSYDVGAEFEKPLGNDKDAALNRFILQLQIARRMMNK